MGITHDSLMQLHKKTREDNHWQLGIKPQGTALIRKTPRRAAKIALIKQIKRHAYFASKGPHQRSLRLLKLSTTRDLERTYCSRVTKKKKMRLELDQNS